MNSNVGVMVTGEKNPRAPGEGFLPSSSVLDGSANSGGLVVPGSNVLRLQLLLPERLLRAAVVAVAAASSPPAPAMTLTTAVVPALRLGCVAVPVAVIR